MLDIRDFGADSTGSQDSSQALQNAINAAAEAINSAGSLNQGVDGTVFVPAGVFKIAQQITIPSTTGSQPLRILGAVVGNSRLNLIWPTSPLSINDGVTQLPLSVGYTPILSGTTGGTVPPNTYSLLYTYYDTSTAQESGASPVAVLTTGIVQPPAPGLSAGSGGTVAANTYYCVITYVTTYGETVASCSNTAITIVTGPNQSIVITSPPASGSGTLAATGWKCYIGTGATGPYHLQGGTNSIGTNLTISTTPSTTGANPPTTSTSGPYNALSYNLNNPNTPTNISFNAIRLYLSYPDPCNPASTITGFLQQLSQVTPATGTITSISGLTGGNLPPANTLMTQTPLSSANIGQLVAGNGIPSGTVITSFFRQTSQNWYIVGLSGPVSKAYSSALAVTFYAPKIIALGVGTLVMEHLTLEDTGIDKAPFVFSASMILRISNVQFYGALYHASIHPYNYRQLSGATISGTQLSAANGQFSQTYDVGAAVIGNGIPANTYIESVQSSTSCTMSASGGSQTNVSPYLVYSYQDAIVLGGTSGVQDSTLNGAFAGYGTVVERCFFSYIRRGVFFRSDANACVFRDNAFNVLCGAGFTWEAAIDVEGGSTGCGSNLISGNLIEIQTYVNGVRFLNTGNNATLCNYVGDSGALISESGGSASTAYQVSYAAGQNLIMGGTFSGPPVGNPSGSNSVLVPHTNVGTDGQSAIISQQLTLGGNLVGSGIGVELLSLQVPMVAGTAYGPSGTNTYQYQVYPITVENTTAAPATVTISNQAVLGGANYNQLDITNVAGAVYYYVFGRTSGSLEWLATVFPNDDVTTTWVDNGTLAQDSHVQVPPLVGPQLVVQASQGQTANVQEWWASTGSVVAYVDAAGNATFANFATGHVTSDVVFSGTSLGNITGLSFSLGANQRWSFEAYLEVVSASTNGGTIAVSVPTGATVLLMIDGPGSSTTSYKQSIVTAGGTKSTTFLTVAATGFVNVRGTVVNSTTAGTVQLQGASGSTSNFTVKQNSYLTARLSS